MARPDTPILNRIAQVNDGRSAITGEASGRGFLGGLGEQPRISREPLHKTLPRLPEKDTPTCYAFKTGVASHRLIFKSTIDGGKS